MESLGYGGMDITEKLGVVGTCRESDWDTRGIAEDATREIRRLRDRVASLQSDVCFLRSECESDRAHGAIVAFFYVLAVIASFLLGFSMRNF